eukprot:7486018-Alexandrium_andersonii.AAC.1
MSASLVGSEMCIRDRYGELLGGRWPVAELLAARNNIVDLAYAEAKWRRAQVLGRERRPWGLRRWPREAPEAAPAVPEQAL